jgi:hypothetical protein
MPQGSLKNKRRTRLAKQKQDQPASTMPKYVQTCRSFFLGTTICLSFGNKLCFTHKTKQNKHGVFPCPLLPLARRQTFTGSALFRTKCNNSLKFKAFDLWWDRLRCFKKMQGLAFGDFSRLARPRLRISRSSSADVGPQIE